MILSCHLKRRHDSRAAALAAIRRHVALTDFNGRDRAPLVVYPCRFCSGFHIGHATALAKRQPYKRERFHCATGDET